MGKGTKWMERKGSDLILQRIASERASERGKEKAPKMSRRARWEKREGKRLRERQNKNHIDSTNFRWHCICSTALMEHDCLWAFSFYHLTLASFSFFLAPCSRFRSLFLSYGRTHFHASRSLYRPYLSHFIMHVLIIWSRLFNVLTQYHVAHIHTYKIRIWMNHHKVTIIILSCVCVRCVYMNIVLTPGCTSHS